MLADRSSTRETRVRRLEDEPSEDVELEWLLEIECHNLITVNGRESDLKEALAS